MKILKKIICICLVAILAAGLFPGAQTEVYAAGKPVQLVSCKLNSGGSKVTVKAKVAGKQKGMGNKLYLFSVDANVKENAKLTGKPVASANFKKGTVTFSVKYKSSMLCQKFVAAYKKGKKYAAISGAQYITNPEVLAMGDIFNLDNKFFQTLGKGVDCVCLSLLWMICCIPLAFGIYVAYVSKAIILALPCIILAVPAGIATTALYYAVNKVIRHSRGYLWSSFWHSFKTNMKQGAFVTLVVAAAVVLVGLDGYIMYQFAKAGEKSGVLYVVFFVLMLVVIAWAIYVFPYMARFENSTKLILKNSALMAIGNLPKTFMALMFFLACCIGTYLLPVVAIISPALGMLLLNYILEGVFERYMSDEDREAENERNQEFYN